jgi:hypothetical protein
VPKDVGDCISLAANAAAVSTTAYGDVAGLGHAVVAGRTYRFRAFIIWRSAAATTGARFSVNGPATPTKLSYIARWTGLTDPVETLYTGRAYDAGTASTGVAALNVDEFAIIEGVIIPSANGTLIPRVASEVAASAITPQAGSYFEVQEVGAV